MKEIEIDLLNVPARDNSTRFILGQTGSGKTTLIANIIRGEKRFIIFDMRGTYKDNKFFPSMIYVSSLKELADAMNKGAAKIHYHLQPEPLELDAAIAYIVKFQTVNCDKLPPVTIVVDEMNFFADSNTTPLPALKEIVERGRDRNIHKVFGAQWFGKIPTWMRNSFSEIYAFGHNDKAGLIRLQEYGYDPEELKALEKYHCIHRKDTGEQEILRLVAGTDSKTTNHPAKETVTA